MKSFVRYLLATAVGVVFGFFLIIALSVGGIMALFLFSGSGKMQSLPAEASILRLELRGEIVERAERFGLDFGEDFNFLNRYQKTGLIDIRNAIKRAKEDKQIQAIYLRLQDLNTGWASAKAIRDELSNFKSAGKKIFAYSDRYAEKGYFVATVADRLYVYPEGDFEFNGLSVTPIFYKGLLDKLEITPQIFRVGKYKSAVEPFTLKQLSYENRMQLQKMIDDIWQEFLEVTSIARKSDPLLLKRFLEDGLINNGKAAKQYALVDELRTEEQVIEELLKELKIKTENPEEQFIGLDAYLRLERVTKNKKASSNKLAVIFAEGVMVDTVGGSDQFTADSIVRMLQKAKRDKEIKGVILRINSPGGSALAADLIWSEVESVKKIKPVYASFGDMAASGGYYMVAGADKIFAERSTLTGSIGVFGVMMHVGKLLQNKLGITTDRVVTNRYADIGNATRPMTIEETKIIQAEVERIYKRFTSLVKIGRKFSSAEKVEEIAQGRIWSGQDGKRLGLIDEVGGLDLALNSMGKSLKLKDYQVELFPKNRGLGWMLENLATLYTFYAGNNWKLIKRFNGIYSIFPYFLVIE